MQGEEKNIPTNLVRREGKSGGDGNKGLGNVKGVK
jgi:hypothetical protein